MVFKRVLIALIMLALLVSAVPAHAAYSMPYFIEVDLTNQLVTIYSTADGSIVRQMLCSSGEPGHDTIEGTFYLPAKDRDDERSEWYNFYTQHVYAKWATRIEGPYLFHSIPCHRPNLDTVVPEYLQQFGMPDSHGCVRLRVEDAYFIAKNCLRGTRVHIYKSGELDEDLRQLLFISSYTNEDGMTYQEFLGISDDSLGRGSSGQEVMDLQYRLSELGYYEGEPDGIYDNKMIATVKRLQRDMGISDTGITSDSMLEVIYSDEAPVSGGIVTLKEGKSGPVVKKLQEALNTLGLYNGDFDSILDLDVIEAVKKFQSACRYDVNGVLTPEIQQAVYYTVEKLEEKFGKGNIPPVELITEEYWKCTLEASANIKIRQQASTESDELGKIFVGEDLIVASVDGDWANIVYKGINGYIYKKYLSAPTTEYSYNLLYSDGSSEYRIGKTLSEYLKGARSFADDFADLYASEQFSESSDEVVPFVTVNTGADNVALNMRAMPNGEAEVLETIPNGTNLRVLASEGDWTKVGYGESIGYLMNQYLSFWEGAASSNEETSASGVSLAEMDADELARISGKAKVVITELEGKKVKPILYKEPDKKSKEITIMTEGAEVEIVEFVEDAELDISWVKISYMGTSGYMMDMCLEFEFEAA